MISPVPLPPAVLPGDRVGVAALSGPVDPGRLEKGLAALVQLGFEPCLAANLQPSGSRSGLLPAPAAIAAEPAAALPGPPGYLAGADEERLEAFHQLAADPSLKAIFFARGGYGVLRLLDRIDWDLLAACPRAYVGYSDLTPFLHQVVLRLGHAAFLGPMVAADLARGLTAAEGQSLLAALAGKLPRSYPAAGWLRQGEAAGPLLGGCLSLVAAALGTPFQADLAGAVLFLEDVNEHLYRLDRLLTQLRLAGALGAAAGVVLGHLDLAPGEAGPGLQPLLAERLAVVPGPVGWGLPCGHSCPNLTLPLGAAAHLGSPGGLVVGIS